MESPLRRHPSSTQEPPGRYAGNLACSGTGCPGRPVGHGASATGAAPTLACPVTSEAQSRERLPPHVFDVPHGAERLAPRERPGSAR